MAFQFKPDPNEASPLYLQLAQKLAQAIREGQYKADEALPSERVLSESLDLSRVTARKAIDRLVEQGLIIRKRGSGNYIALPESVLPDPQTVEASLYEHLSKAGGAPVRALQHLRAINADAKLALLLEVPVGQAVLFITRVGFAESGQAIELTHSYCRSDYYDFVAEMKREG